jgi:hypothetical protein
MEYGRIIKRALEVTWKHKVLWIFGIAAALFTGGGSGGGGGRAWNSLQYTFNQGDLLRWRGQWPPLARLPWLPGQLRWPEWSTIVPAVLGLIGLILVFALILAVVSVIVRYTSIGALVGMVDEVERTERTSFQSGLRKGWSRLLRLFAIDLLLAVAGLVVVLIFVLLVAIGVAVVAGPAALLASGGRGLVALGIIWGVGTGLVALVVIIVIALALSALFVLVREYAFRACVIDQQGVFGALEAAVKLLRARLQESVLMWLLLLAINLALGLLTIPLAILGIAGLVGPALALYGATRSVAAALVVAIPVLVLIILASAVIGGVYLTFRSAVWTLTYRELRGQKLVEAA